MSYWIDQPINISELDEIKIIKTDVSKKKNDILPDGFKFKTLGTAYLDEIHGLISNHYVEDKQHLIRLVYSKDFLYWYLKYIPAGFVVGLVYKNKLVGMVAATFLDMIIYNIKMKVPYINFLCVQSKIRNLGLAPLLMDEIKARLCQINMSYALFTSMKLLTKPFSTSIDFVVPINYVKLKEVGFLLEDLPEYPRPESNPFHLMTGADMKSVVPKLNTFVEKFDIKPYFTEDSARHFLLSKKNIVYSFVKRNDKQTVTDFVTVYKNYLYCIEKNKMISVAQLAFYYHETMDLTELITNLIDKLPGYGIDQLIFRNLADGPKINITKFAMYDKLNYFFFNVAIKETDPTKICFYPI